MIRFSRRILVILILYSILLFVGNLQIGKEYELINVLAKLGFIILSAFTLGEITHSLNITHVFGYLLSGIIFGPYLFQHSFFTPIISSNVHNKLSLINNIAIGFLAFAIGFHLKRKDTIVHTKAILINLSISFFTFISIAAPVIFFTSIYFLNLSLVPLYLIVIGVLFIAVNLINSSLEFNSVLIDETDFNNDQKMFLRYLTVSKELFVILIISTLLFGYSYFANNNKTLSISVFYFSSIGYSILFGLFLGLIGLIYVKYIKVEFIIFTITFIIIGSEVAKLFELNTLVVFFIAGATINRFTTKTQDLITSFQTVASPLAVIFFSLFISEFNFFKNPDIIFAALIISGLRILLTFISYKLSANLSVIPNGTNKYGWYSFLSLGTTPIFIAAIFSSQIPAFSPFVELLFAIVFINALINPLLFKLGASKTIKINNLNGPENNPVEGDEPLTKLSAAQKKETKFVEPNIKNSKINKSLFQILFKLNDIFREFEKKFITNRSEESLELVIEIIEHYSEEYNKLKKALIQPKAAPSAIRNAILKSEESTSEWYINFIDKRKSIEKNILNLEPLIRQIFHSLTDLTEGLQTDVIVDLSENNFILSEGNSLKLKITKLWFQTKYKLIKPIKKTYSINITLPYKNLVKFYLLGQSSNEILETVNLVGIERLTALRQIKRLYNDHLSNLNELIKLLNEEKDNVAFSVLIFEKFEEQHKQFINEINLIQTEINETSNQISNRLQYALANPFNRLVASIDNIINLNTPPVHYKFSKIFAKSEKARELALDTIRYWINYYLGYLGFFKKEAVINKLKIELTEVVNTSLGEISDEINEKLRNLINSIGSKIRSLNEKISAPDANINTIIYSANRELLKESITINLNNLEYIRKSKKFNLLIENLIKSFSLISTNLPKKILLLEESDLQINDRLPKFMELKQINIFEASKELLEHKLPREIGEVNELLLNYVNLTILEIKNIYSIAEYHILTAQKEIERSDLVNTDLAFEIIQSLFDKLKIKIDSLTNEVTHLDHNLTNKINEKVGIVISDIDEVVNHIIKNRTNSILSTDLSSRNLKYSIITNYYLFIQYIKNIAIFIKKTYKNYFKNYFEQFLYRIGIKEFREENITTGTIFSNEDKLKTLPFIYRKLFDGTPLESSDFFIGREKFIEMIKISLTNYFENKPSSILIVGEPGSGKRSLINTIKNIVLKDLDFTHHQFIDAIINEDEILEIFSNLLGFTKRLSYQELIIELNDKSNKRIFIFENIGKLFLRKFNGYEAIKLFQNIISQTQNNVLWICSVGKYPWDFYSNNFNLGNIFTQKIYTNSLHQKDIKTIVMSRHNATGFDVMFKPNDFRRFKNKIFKVKSNEIEQKKLSDEFFAKLEEYSEGNITSAMYYWLQSIEEINNNRLFMRPPQRILLTTFEKFDTVYLIILSTIFRHGWIADTELSEIINLPLEETKNRVEYLANLDLIYHDQIDLDSNRYFINKFVFKIIEIELTKRNML